MNAGEQIAKALAELSALSGEELRRQRREKFLAMGRNLV
jgi:acetyl-CoA carboxylase carboxyl transferase subunit alpha